MKTPAPVKISLSPYPRLVRTAHLGLYGVNTTEVAIFCDPTEERTYGDIPPGFRIPHFKDHDIAEVFWINAGT